MLPFRRILVTSVLVLLAAIGTSVAESVNLAWSPNAEPNIAGYRILVGVASGQFTRIIDAGPATTASVPDLSAGTTYFFAVTAYNTVGLESLPSAEISYTVPGGPEFQGLVNASTRGYVQTGENVLIGGLIIAGDTPKKIVLRAIGPSLAAVGVSGALADPVLSLHDSTGAMIASNDNWRTAGGDVIATALAPSNDLEAALVATLSPGAYTAVVSAAGNEAGVALFEIYDVDRSNSRLANISTRGRVDAGDKVMIGGFIIGGDQSSQILVRVLGPSLARAGVSDALLNPNLELHNANGDSIFANDNWRSAQANQISATGLAPGDGLESAIIATLPPGSYTAIARGAQGDTGVCLIEIYNLTR